MCVCDWLQSLLRGALTGCLLGHASSWLTARILLQQTLWAMKKERAMASWGLSGYPLMLCWCRVLNKPSTVALPSPDQNAGFSQTMPGKQRLSSHAPSICCISVNFIIIIIIIMPAHGCFVTRQCPMAQQGTRLMGGCVHDTGECLLPDCVCCLCLNAARCRSICSFIQTALL